MQIRFVLFCLNLQQQKKKIFIIDESSVHRIRAE